MILRFLFTPLIPKFSGIYPGRFRETLPCYAFMVRGSDLSCMLAFIREAEVMICTRIAVGFPSLPLFTIIITNMVFLSIFFYSCTIKTGKMEFSAGKDYYEIFHVQRE